MNRIDQTFSKLKREGRKGLVGYLTAGDPNLAASERNIRAAIDAGLDVLELGVPFSDPTADGPTIQEAAQRALAAGTTLADVLGMVSRLRRDYADIPIVLFGYANPFYRYGFDRIAEDAARAGADGLLVVDMPFEESEELRAPLVKHGLCFILLVAPTTPPGRAAAILAGAQGFVYYIMVTGVTGARESVVSDLAAQIGALRQVTGLPIAVGFGVSNGAQARDAATTADAVVVGSALVRAAHEGRAGAFVRELRDGLSGRSPAA
ncbi:MAG: tryptophan synthase subunit alpha [Lentisphaerae bacterium]|nr:tryptophan synthase subunit alpha [Lentisphaerota bacterium]